VDEQQRVVSKTEIVSPPTAANGRKPPWIRVKAPTSQGYHATRQLMRTKQLHTDSEEAACPNIGE
jgi:lipoic acid synthetase